MLYYPTLWTLAPLLALAAIRAHGEPARLSVAIFAAAFVLHSLAAAKDMRYLAYALPFLFAFMAMGVMSLVRELGSRLLDAITIPISRLGPNATRRFLVAGTLAFVVLANGATPRLVTMLAGIRVPPQPPLVRWHQAEPSLRPWLERVHVVVTTDELAALYYLGDYDVVISSSRLSEIPDAPEFGRDHRTGRPVIGTAPSLRRLLDCFPSGLVVSGRTRLQDGAKREVAALLQRETRPLGLPAGYSLDAFVWQDRVPTADPIACAALIERLPPRGA